MIEELQKLLDSYAKWVRDKTSLKQVNDWIEITTPYLDRHNDYIQIYAKQSNGDILLTDDGYIINDLMDSGCKLESPKRQHLLSMTLKGFGVQMDGEAIQIQAAPENFPLRKHNLIQAMLAVNDLFYLAQPTIESLFIEDVEHWLDSYAIRFTSKLKLTGKTGFDYMFDFVIPKSTKQPERLLQAINQPDKGKAQAAVLAWIDTREVRASDARAYAVLNDRDRTVSTSVLDALKSYDVKPILFTKRDEFRKELAA